MCAAVLYAATMNLCCGTVCCGIVCCRSCTGVAICCDIAAILLLLGLQYTAIPVVVVEVQCGITDGATVWINRWDSRWNYIQYGITVWSYRWNNSVELQYRITGGITGGITGVNYRWSCSME
jgi:hypothetical protein